MVTDFKQFKLKPYLYEALAAIHFQKPTPIQSRLIPQILKGTSVVGSSQTGSGKTHTFLLPIFQMLDEQSEEVQAVITAPSRELAQQIYQAAQQIAEHSPEPIRIHAYIGGTDKKRQIEKLQNNQPQIVIGTPGRILDLCEAKALKIHTTKVFVVDEADMALDLGFLGDVDKIASRMPEELQMMVFSATIPQKLQPFLKKYLHDPLIEEIPSETVISNTVDNWLVAGKGRDVGKMVYQLISVGNPYLVLIFANTKTKVDEIHHYLTEKGLKVAKIHGDVPPRERKRIMKEVQNLDFQFVVATDLAARGIDIEGVSHVINAEIPKDLDFFIHRVGRTGRNGLPGIAITLYQPGEENRITEIENLGITFVPKEIKQGAIVDSYDRNRRTQRKIVTNTLDPKVKSYMSKKKKKVKPGYKKQIKAAIARSEHEQRKTKRRQVSRSARRANRSE